jgi:prepilin-type N-terminal cleavage/methylation domain-containing protein
MRCTESRNVRSPRRDRRQSGFTLIEILVAMTVTMIGLAGLMSLYVTTVQGNSRATRAVIASTIAQQTMEELRSLPVAPPQSTLPYQGPTLQSVFGIPAADVPLANVTGPDGTDYRRLVSVTPLGVPPSPLANLVRVRLEVTWADEGADPTTTNARLRHEFVLEAVRTRQDIL